MLERIADFFHFMCDNKEKRLYYVLPIDKKLPYAYQHSAIRDIATVCDILDLVQVFEERQLKLTPHTLNLFEEVAGNSINFYQRLYLQGRWAALPESNIGDLGFFLLALLKCQDVFPSQSPKNGRETVNLIIEQLTERQKPDGSLQIFFDKSLKPFEGSAEAFYLPEALIGLIAALKRVPMDQRGQIKETVQKAVAYLCDGVNRKRHLAADHSTFYFNWQAQLLYHWIHINKDANLSLEITHLQSLIASIKSKEIAQATFNRPVATVEVACYFEGLVHAKRILEMLNLPATDTGWFSKEIDRCLAFLYELQNDTFESFHGGFIHSRGDNEARVDVAGHIFGALRFL